MAAVAHLIPTSGAESRSAPLAFMADFFVLESVRLNGQNMQAKKGRKSVLF
jgi:hypothetical protein